MAVGPIAAGFIGWACGKFADKALSNLAGNTDLRNKLDKAVADWAKSLPKDKYVNPQALFPTDATISKESDRPEYHELQQLLLKNVLPGPDTWHKVFMESWHYVKKTISEPQPFFKKLSQKQASEELMKLAQSTYNICKQNETIFKSVVIDKLVNIDNYLHKNLPAQDKNKTGPKKPIQNLPYPSIGDLFKGRDDVLKKLKSRLDDNKPTAITQAIEGLGGIGKTRLAIEFGWWVWNNKKAPAVLFVSAETLERLNASLASLADEKYLNLPGRKEAEQIGAVLCWLSDNPGWLMILDNADDEEAAEAVEDLLPRLANGRVIITSRYKRWSASVKPHSLDLLPLKKAMQFLLDRTADRRIQTDDDKKLAAQLAKELDRLPLALEQAAAYISHNQCSFADYLHQWESERQKVLEWYDERQMKYPASVAITWQRTFEQLGPPSRALLHLSAFLAPEMIPSEMFEKSIDIVKETVELLTGKKPTKRSKLKIDEILSELAAYSMITRQTKGFTVHRILQEVIRSRIPEESRPNWITMSLQIVNNFAPTDSDDVRTWPVLDVLRPHAELISKTADQAQITEPTSRLMSVLDCYLFTKGLFSKAEYWSRRALKIDEASFGPDHPNVATDLNNLAGLLRVTNRFSEAEPMMRRALKIDEKSFGPDHPNVAIDLNNLAQLLQDTNRLSEAEPMYRRALKICEASFGPDHPKVAIRLNNLAGLLRDTNRLSEAETMYRGALKIDEASFSPDHPNVATDLNNLAGLLQDTNRNSEAEPMYSRALKILEDSLGPDHPNTKTIRNNLQTLK